MYALPVYDQLLGVFLFVVLVTFRKVQRYHKGWGWFEAGAALTSQQCIAGLLADSNLPYIQKLKAWAAGVGTSSWPPSLRMFLKLLVQCACTTAIVVSCGAHITFSFILSVHIALLLHCVHCRMNQLGFRFVDK